ncbi:ABC transporter permease [Chondrinema litorale]|uniref:ABC transporter permease n=1 Tax=Chondrinema litorale TaxID=2994555 RepID=UPI002542F1E4|nr:ABC transporter permease [Chondrinema litorale]UZR97649.1 ABC transporter permease [Chondrinema litorale]
METFNPKPPKWIDKLLERICPSYLIEEILGDLHERYALRAERVGEAKAKRQYMREVMAYMRTIILSKSSSEYNKFISMGMLSNYLKVAWRNLTKNLGYSFINIGGLALGMAVAIIIGLWIHDELSFNKNHENYDRIARVMRNGTLNGETFTTNYEPYALGEELRDKYGSNFDHVVMVMSITEHILADDENKLYLEGGFIEKEGPEMFTFNMIEGTRKGLDDPNSIILSASGARALFGDENPIDKTLKLDNNLDVKVTGVYEDLPHNSHFQGISFFAPFELYYAENEWISQQGFGNNFLDVYVQISEQTDFETVTASIKDVIIQNLNGSGNKGYLQVNPQLFLHPMAKWHLYSEFNNGKSAGGLIQFVWLFGIVGLFVLLLACINFMNLNTARSENRAKEVGIRKAIGSVRKQLIGQFLSESFLVVVLSFYISLILVSLSLNWFNDIADKQISMPWSNIYFWLASLSFIIFTGFVSGSYPALYLSSFHPVRVLKGTFRAGRFASLPRKVLVVFQFTVSVTLVIGTIIVFKQIQFAKDRPVGYTRENLLSIPMMTSEFHQKYEVLETSLLNTGMVAESAQSLGSLTGIGSSNGGFNWRDKNPDFQIEFATITVSADYGETVGWEFLQGRDFSSELASDSSGFIINETAAKMLGFDNPVGEEMHWSPGWKDAQNYTVTGVIKDMVMQSPYAPPMPTVFYLDGFTNTILVKIKPEVSVSEALPQIERVLKETIPSAPFNFKFADQEYALKFAAEERIGKLASVFAVLTIFISCLGLFGLASFVAEQRTKEIGIRKILGASVINLWKMLSKDFVILVLISSFIAIPLAYFLLNNWLENYEYKTEISWWIFMVSGGGALGITLLTVSFQAIKSALANPIKSLRNE